MTEAENLALACPRCNARKWKHVEAVDFQTGELAPLFNPRIHQWTEHFCWSSTDSVLIEPLTGLGRATVVLLDLNSTQHLAIRTLLRALSLHPPVGDVA
jgi:hypothetical protein